MFNKNIWIEKYTLRYGVGTITGALIISFEVCMHAFHDMPWNIFVVLLLSGFAFSFIASAPLYVFHVCRGLKSERVCKLVFLLLSITLLIINISSFKFSATISNKIINSSHLILFIFLLMNISIYFILIDAFILRKNLIYDYFEKLSYARSSMSNQVNLPKSQLIETYREIRENGNAFGIIFLQLVLYIVYCSIKDICGFSNQTQVEISKLAPILCFFIFPGWVAMYLGTRLEQSMVGKNNVKNKITI